MPERPPRKKAKRRSSSRRPLASVDSVLLRCATIERRLEGIETAMNIQAQRMSAMQAQIDHIASNPRS